MKLLKISTENLAVNFCTAPLIVSFGAWLLRAKKALGEAATPLKDCLRDAFGWFGAGERIAELTDERAQLAEQMEALERENLALHVERQQAFDNGAAQEKTINYLMAEKTRLTSLNAELCARLASAPPTPRYGSKTPSRLDQVAARAARTHAPLTAPGAQLN